MLRTFIYISFFIIGVYKTNKSYKCATIKDFDEASYHLIWGMAYLAAALFMLYRG